MSLEPVESKLKDYEPSSSEDKTVPLLRALLQFAPQVGHRYLIKEIMSCQDDKALEQLAERYLTGLISPVRAAGEKTPPVTVHPSRPSADFDEVINSFLIESVTRDQTKLKSLTLRRDNFRCMVTGVFDYNSYLQGVEYDGSSGRPVTTVAAHILPFSLMPKDPAGQVQVDRASMPWRVISAFSGIQLNELNGPQINRLENVLTLEFNIHNIFGSLNLCFDATETPNVYNILTFGELVQRYHSYPPVTLTTTHARSLAVARSALSGFTRHLLQSRPCCWIGGDR